MILLNVEGVIKHYGPEAVLDGTTFEIRPGERIALVGPNGAGKTTLLRILAGLEAPDNGHVEWHSSARFGFLQQHPEFPPGHTVWDEARAALGELVAMAHDAERLAHEISECEDEAHRKKLGTRFDQLQHELHRRDGYHLDHKIERVLAGLGFDATTFRQPAATLSGGQQNRLLLAKLLLADPDLLLLDEPSNHLDIEATEWLETFLVESGRALLVVSHDRYLLDKVATRTLELFRGTVDSYPGNFTQYQRLKADRLEVQRRTFEKQQGEIAKMEDFIRRNSYGQKHAQAEDRRKKLERIERVVPPREIAAPPMGFPDVPRVGDIVLRIERLAKGFDRPLFADLTFDILRGEKWGILGPNGTGKTTLLRCLLGLLPADEGRVVIGTGVKIGYFDQLLSCLPDDVPVVEAVRPTHKEFVDQQRRDLLARFGLTGDIVFQPVRSLSGGERNRAALALLAASDANLLVLDEPTNHLDLWARDSLERAVRRFEGTVLFVSHDRYFLNQVADHLLVVEPAAEPTKPSARGPAVRFRTVEGNYDTYRMLLRAAATPIAAPTASASAPAKRAEPEKSDKPGRRKRKFPYRKVTDLEADIYAVESQVEAKHHELTLPEVLRDGPRVKQIMAELDQLQQQRSQLYEHWEEASELNG